MKTIRTALLLLGLLAAPGVREATVSFADGLARVQYNPHAVSEGRLVDVIEGGGFSVPARQP